MKLKFKHISTIVLFAVLLSSCLIEDGDPDREKTDTGFFVYAYTADRVLSQYLFCLDVAIKLDSVLSETDQLKADKLEDIYFPQYKIRERGDTCVLVSFDNESSDIMFLRRGTSLKAENAYWSVLLGDKKKWIDLRRNTASEFRVEAAEAVLIDDFLIGSTKLVVAVTTLEDKYKEDNSVYSYSISGVGSYSEKRPETYSSPASAYYVDYVFESKLAAYLVPGLYNSRSDDYTQRYSYKGDYYYDDYSNSSYTNMFEYHDGGLSMTVSGDAVVDETQGVKAVLSSEMYNTKIEITYRGFTETW